MTEEIEIPTHDVTVTCRTDGCDNAGYPIVLNVPVEPSPPNVACGVCGHPITDIT
jgi:hypothetical protein